MHSHSFDRHVTNYGLGGILKNVRCYILYVQSLAKQMYMYKISPLLNVPSTDATV